MSHILIIDDEKAICEMLTILLERAGYAVSTAEDGDVAERLFGENEFDLVITDIIMPNKEGIETIMTLKKIRPNVPIIAMSGGAKVNPDCYLSIAKQLGAKYSFSKPFNNKELLDAVTECLG